MWDDCSYPVYRVLYLVLIGLETRETSYWLVVLRLVEVLMRSHDYNILVTVAPSSLLLLTLHLQAIGESSFLL